MIRKRTGWPRMLLCLACVIATAAWFSSSVLANAPRDEAGTASFDSGRPLSTVLVANLDRQSPSRGELILHRDPSFHNVPFALEAGERRRIQILRELHFPFGARLDAADPIAALARTEWRNEQVDGDAIAYSQGASADGEMFLPLMLDSALGTSSYSILNTSLDDPAMIEVRAMYGSVVSHRAVTISQRLEPGAFSILDRGGIELSRVPRGHRAARLRADTAVAVHGFVDRRSGSSHGGVAGFEALSRDQAAHRLVAPLLHHDVEEAPGAHARSSLLSVLNAGDEAADVSVRVMGTKGSCVGRSYDITAGHGSVVGFKERIPAGQSAVFSALPDRGLFLQEDHALPNGCRGTAIVESEGAPVLAALLDVEEDDRMAGAYSLEAMPEYEAETGAASASAYLPALLNRAPFAATAVIAPELERPAFTTHLPEILHEVQGLSSRVHAMNASRWPAVIRIQLFDAGGQRIDCGPACIAAVGPERALHLRLADLPALEPGFDGYAIIESDRPLSVVGEHYPMAEKSDYALYRGIRVDDNSTKRTWLPTIFWN